MSIIAVLIRFEGESAIFKTKEGDIVSWPKNMLPKNAELNAVFKLAISSENDLVSAGNELAKDILNEILNTSQDEKI